MLTLNLLNQIFFFNIGRFASTDTFFNWTNKSYHKTSIFDVRMTRNPSIKNIFYCLQKTDLKIVYTLKKEDEVVFSIGSDPEVQSQLLEAILEYLIEKFFSTFDKSLFMTCYGEKCNIFDGFNSIVEETFKNYENLDIIETALVTCKGCKKTIPVIMKKSLIESSEKSATPLVYSHSGHALLIYIDKHFKVRGNEIVDVSY